MSAVLTKGCKRAATGLQRDRRLNELAMVGKKNNRPLDYSVLAFD